MLLSTLIAGFLGKKQYTAMPLSRLVAKLAKERCSECFIRAMFLDPSLLMHSIMALFRSGTLSGVLIKAFFMLFLSLVINRM
jgi:hypothetical protein